MGFFKRIKTAITSFEKYQIFANEDTSKAIKYFFIIMLIFAIFTLLAILYPLINITKDGIEYMKANIPNFSIKDGTLTIDSEEPLIIKNEDLSLVLYINTSATADDVNVFFEENKEYNNVLLLSEKNVYGKAMFFSGMISEEYKTISETVSINEISKEQLIDYFDNSGGYAKLFGSMFMVIFMYYFVLNIAFMLLDVLILVLLGLITAKLYKINLNFKKCFNMSIYALTLPIILRIAYVIINSFTGFTIEQFGVMYRAISYIYIVTAILMMRDYTDKTASDLMKIEGEVKKEENEEIPTEEPKKDENKKKEKENDDSKENKENKGTPEPNPGKA